jgi:hypothetical protein
MPYIIAPIYTLRKALANPAINITQLQLKGPAARSLIILGFGATPMTAVTSSTTWPLQIGRIPTTFGTVTTSVAGDIQQNAGSSVASTIQLGTAASGFTATVEPTYTDKWVKAANALGPLEQIYIPESAIILPGATGVGLVPLLAPPAGTYDFWIQFCEVA